MVITTHMFHQMSRKQPEMEDVGNELLGSEKPKVPAVKLVTN